MEVSILHTNETFRFVHNYNRVSNGIRVAKDKSRVKLNLYNSKKLLQMLKKSKNKIQNIMSLYLYI